MPATGFTPIQLYRSSTASATPLAGNLSAGELAVNIADEKIYLKNSGGSVVLYTGNPLQTGNAGKFLVTDGTNQSWTSTFGSAVNYNATQTIASAGTTNLATATSNSIIVSGTTTITALGTIAAGAERMVVFSGALTLTHNATSLILPGGANITTAAGDSAYFVSLGSGNWRCTGYQKANGQGVATLYPGAGIANSTGSAWGTSYSTTGSGTVLALATSPTFVTPVLGTIASGDLAAGTNAVAYGIKSATTTVSVSAATAPSTGQVLTATSSTAATWQTPSGGGGGTLNAITAATGAATINNAENAIVWNWNGSTASRTGFTIGENAASTGGAGSQYLLTIGTLNASTANPFRVQTQGATTANFSYDGSITLTAYKNPSTGVGMPLNLNGGAGIGAGNIGGAVNITAGNGTTTATGGALTLTSGSGGASGAAGNLALNVGTTNAGTAAALTSNAVRIAIGSGSSVHNSGGTAIGAGAAASGLASVAITSATNTATASGISSIAIGAINGVLASANSSTAIGQNSSSQGSQAVTGSGAMALGGSYASGTDSFAAAIGNNTSTYGAQGANSVAIGSLAKATGSNSFSFGNVAQATNTYSYAFGFGSIASGNAAYALGREAQAAQTGKYAFSSGTFGGGGDAQYGVIVLRASTTGSTVVMASDAGAASTANQLIVATNQVMAFTGTLIGKQTGSANIAAYEIKGTLVNNAGTVTMPTGTLTLIGTDSITLTTAPTLAADNTNKGLTVTSGAKTATNIRWVATIRTSELTYA